MNVLRSIGSIGLVLSVWLPAASSAAVVRYGDDCDEFLTTFGAGEIVERSRAKDFFWAQLEAFVEQGGIDAAAGLLSRESDLQTLAESRDAFRTAAGDMRRAEAVVRETRARFEAAVPEDDRGKRSTQLGVLRFLKVFVIATRSFPKLVKATKATRHISRLHLGVNLVAPAKQGERTIGESIRYLADVERLYAEMAERAESVLAALDAKLEELARATAVRRQRLGGDPTQIVDL